MFKHYDDDDLKKKCKFNYIITIKKMKIRRPYCYLRVCFKKGGVNLKILMRKTFIILILYHTCILHKLR